MYYMAVDDDRLFVNGDGNHRTCIARFMFAESGRTMLHGVTVEKYRVDRKALEGFDRLKRLIAQHRLPLMAAPRSKTVSRDDTAGWMRERYAVEIVVTDVEKNTEVVLASQGFKQFN